MKIEPGNTGKPQEMMAVTAAVILHFDILGAIPHLTCCEAQLQWYKLVVLDSGHMFEPPGELVKESTSQPQPQTVKPEPGGGSGFCIFSGNSLGGSDSRPGLRSTGRAQTF